MHVELAPAKLTVHLHMIGRRDDGYHLLESEMVSLDFADRLEFSEGDGLEIVGNNALSTGDDNLVNRALRLCGRRARVKLHKSIPAGAGLGGGSSDAAAVLRWAGVGDSALAVELGADVPFCVRGGRAAVSGIGEVLQPLPFEERGYTLLLAPFGVDTAAVYRAFDSRDIKNADWSDRNHLQSAAIAVEPRLREWRDFLRNATSTEPVLAGSGSTWFVDGVHPAPSLDELGDAKWIVTKTIPGH